MINSERCKLKVSILKIGETIIVAKELSLSVKDLSSGQTWKNHQGKQFSIVDKWSDKFIVKDKYGDKKKYWSQELLKIIQVGEYKLSSEKHLAEAIVKVIEILTPFIGTDFLTRALIKKYILRLVKK